jgi:hypothetical protein
MKKHILIAVISLLAGYAATAQSQYEISTDKQNGSKVLKGIIARQALESDTAFKWYASGYKAYSPNADGLSALKQYKDSLHIIAFMGTWCEDSHFIIPRFFALTDAAAIPAERITLLGTDRDKKTLGHLAESLNIKNVPTLIVMWNGKEIGRVVEYGKYGMFDKELGEVITTAAKR